MTDANDVAQYNMAFMLPSVKQFLLSFEIILSRTFKSFYYKNIDANSQEYSDVDAVAGSLFMMNVPKMLQYGMFDENVFLYCEEIILGIKFKYNGLKIALLNTERYVHNHSVSISKSYCSNFKRNKLLNRSKLYVLKEYYNAGPITLFLAKILSLINLVESTAIDVLKGRN